MELVFLTLLIVIMGVALTSGFPVAFALPGSAILSIAIAALYGYVVTGDSSAYFSHDGPMQWLSAGVTNFRSLYWNVERDTLIAIPLFIFMGIMLQKSKIAEDLLLAMAKLFGPVPGGLGVSVVFVGTLLAATTGIVGATVIAMGLISLPAMLKHNYSKTLATGTICASGTLGQIIPPSIVLIILADQLSSASDQANTERRASYKEATGEFSMPSEFDVTTASAGDMFMGAMIPGLILVGLYMAYILITGIMKPHKAPPLPYDGEYNHRFVMSTLLSLIPPLTLIFIIMGSIILGVATVNQSGAIGAIGSLIMAGYRLMDQKKHLYTPAILAIIAIVFIVILLNIFDLNIKNIKSTSDKIGISLALVSVTILLISIIWSVKRTFQIDNTLNQVMLDTAKTTSMVFVILIGSAMLTSAFRAFGGEELVKEFLTSLPGGFWTQFFVVMTIIFILGFFLDFVEIAVVIVPIIAPILLSDPSANVTAVWLGVMIGLNIQTSFLTPPFGFSLFYLRGVSPPEVETIHIYKGAATFISLQLIGLTITGLFPWLVNYMPNKSFLTSETAPPPINPRIQTCMENSIFEEYKKKKYLIMEEINSLKNTDFSTLPEPYSIGMFESLDLAANTFILVDRVKSAKKKLEEYNINYRSLHQHVRKIQKNVRSNEHKLNEKIKLHRQMSRQEDITQERLNPVEKEIDQIKKKIQNLVDSIPNQWEEKNDQFKFLALEVKKAQQAYRQNVDNSYKFLKEIKLIINHEPLLSSMQEHLINLKNIISVLSPTDAMKKIKEMENELEKVAGSSHIKLKLAQSRRALKGNKPNIHDCISLYNQSLQLFYVEIEWRTKSKTLLPALNKYDEIIHSNIGLRLQKRLNRDQAKDISSCLSKHKDISLNF